MTPRRPIRGEACAVVAAVYLLTVSAALAIPAFPGAEGFGALATGGRGGTVYHVTNLNDSGPGSFRDAVSQSNRTVVFDVGGVITITSQVAFANNITVAGQTAPGGGITLYGRSISLSGRRNIIIRYLRVRSSIKSSHGSKTVNITDGENIILDHLSISWGRWDDLGVTSKSRDVTIQDCIIAEAIDPQRFGALVDSAVGVTLARNLWINNQSRNPKGKGHLQYVNNVVYNWGGGGYCGGHSAAVWRQDLIGNLFIQGPSCRGGFLVQFAANDSVYQAGNLADLDCDGVLNGRAVVEADFHPMDPSSGPPAFQTAAQNHPPVAVTVLSAEAAYTHVVAQAGASLHRDCVDARLIEQVRSLGKAGAIITDESAVGGTGEVPGGSPPHDTDGDGMPDAWEVANGLNPNDPADSAADSTGDGYTNLEKYLNSLVPLSPPPPATSRPRQP